MTIPNWVYVLFLILGIASLTYTVSKCGWKTALLGNGGLFAAASGMCDD